MSDDDRISLQPLRGLGEIRAGDDLAALIWERVQTQQIRLEHHDILVVTQKIVSKAEGRVVALETVEPSDFAQRYGQQWDKDPRYVEIVLRESRRIVKMDRGLLVTETLHGFICANAGVDESNVAGGGSVSLLPIDSDASAARIRAPLEVLAQVELGVIVSDTFGRPWRHGLVNVAIGVAGLAPIQSYIGQYDPYGYPLKVTEMAFADQIASAAELVMGKTDQVPVALVRGARYVAGPGSAREMVRPPDRDLFR